MAYDAQSFPFPGLLEQYFPDVDNDEPDDEDDFDPFFPDEIPE